MVVQTHEEVLAHIRARYRKRKEEGVCKDCGCAAEPKGDGTYKSAAGVAERSITSLTTVSGIGIIKRRWRWMRSDKSENKGVLKSCKLVEVIQVITIDGEGTEKDPVHESATYFTLDGDLIAKIANGCQQ